MKENLITTTVIENAYDKDCLEAIRQQIHTAEKCIKNVNNDTPRDSWDDTKKYHGPTISNMFNGDWNNIILRELVLSGLPRVLAEHMIVYSINHLQSFIPYQLHSDYGWINCKHDEQPLALMLIPLETVPARTITLDQTLLGLHFIDYIKQSVPLEPKNQLTESEYNQYFSHCGLQERLYISINHVFEWQVGSLLIMDLRRMHGSDNFIKNNLTEKNCITIFTTIKKNNFDKVLEYFNKQ